MKALDLREITTSIFFSYIYEGVKKVQSTYGWTYFKVCNSKIYYDLCKLKFCILYYIIYKHVIDFTI